MAMQMQVVSLKGPILERGQCNRPIHSFVDHVPHSFLLKEEFRDSLFMPKGLKQLNRTWFSFRIKVSEKETSVRSVRSLDGFRKPSALENGY